MIRNLLLFLLLCFTTSLVAQQEYNISVNHYNLKDGLSHNQIRWLHQDSRGMMWIGTGNGINRYDGESFKFVAKSNFFSVVNRRILEDYEGDLWLIGNFPKEELTFFNTHTERIKSFEEKFGNEPPFSSDQFVNAIMLADSTIVVKTKADELIRYDVNKKVDKIEVGVDRIWRLISVQDSQDFWLQSPTPQDTTSGYFHYFAKQEDGAYQQQAKHYIKNAEAIWKTKDARLLFWNKGEQQNYTLLDVASSPQTLPFSTEIDTAYFPSITYDNKEDRFLILHDGKLSILYRDNPADVYTSSVHKDLIAKQVNCALYKDDFLWIGGFYGLTKVGIKPSPFKRAGYKDPAFHTRPEFISVRFVDNHIERLDAEWPRQIPRNGTLGFWSHFTDDNGRVWGADYYGISYFDTDEGSIKFLEGDRKSLTIQRTGRVYQFYKDREGQIWTPSDHGLYQLDIEKGLTARYAPDDSLNYFPTKDLRHMYQDEDGIYWIGTFNGLVRWDKKNNEHRIFTMEDGLSNNHIMSVYEDDYGFIWMSSDNGIMQFEKSTERVKVYLPEDGISHREFNRAAHRKDSLGNIYFGSLNGVTYFHPKDFVGFKDEQPDIPLLLMECNLLSGESNQQEDRIATFQKKKKIVMKPGDRYLNLQFALLDYSNPNSIQYVFDIDGRTWNAGKENTLNVSGLPYGDHVLTVKGRAGNGLFSKQELSIPIEVLRPFYLQHWFLIGSGLLLLLGGYLLQKWRTRRLIQRQIELEETVHKRTITIQNQAEELRQLDKAKSRFLANISHEFRTPLTLILNTLSSEEVTKIVSGNGRRKKLNFSETEVDIMERNAQRLSQLIEQLLDLSTLEAGKMELKESSGDFQFYLKELVQSFVPLADKKKITLSFFADLSNPILYFDRDKMDKIMYNLLSNAIKFTSENGSIKVNLIQLDKETIIEVADNGIGISKEGITNIFDRFYQVNQPQDYTHEGTGLGLSLVKELIEILNGTVQVKSELGSGTIFKLSIPLKIGIAEIPISEKMQETELIFSNKTIAAQPFSKIGETTTKQNQELPIVLVIEDNEDLRFHHQKTFKGQYELIMAADGNIGLEKAFEFIPDLIICDVMMPGKNGYEVCEILKNDERTNHIPVILLTAKAGFEQKIEGLSVGADEYMTKPYDQRELVLKMSNLLEHTALLRKQVALEVSNNLNLEKSRIPSPQEKFLEKLFKVIEENLGERNFGVEELSAKVSLSRSQLSRKLKSITGDTPNKFIRTYRLKRATELLIEEQGNATNVSYLTGFSSPNYFFKCFKDEFGITPSQYMERLEKEYE